MKNDGDSSNKNLCDCIEMVRCSIRKDSNDYLYVFVILYVMDQKEIKDLLWNCYVPLLVGSVAKIILLPF